MKQKDNNLIYVNPLVCRLFGHNYAMIGTRKIPKGTQYVELEGVSITKGKPIKEKIKKIFCLKCGKKNE